MWRGFDVHFVEHGLRGSGMGYFCWRITGMGWGVGVGGRDKLSTLESTDLLDLEIWAVEERE